MSEFEKYIEAKYPNRSPKILFQKFKDIDGTVFYGVKEIEDQAKVWQHQQAKIDDSENTRAVLYRENIDLRERSIELQKRIDVVLEYLDGESSNRWGLWKEKADMMEQGASNAFEEAYWMVKKALRGANDINLSR